MNKTMMIGGGIAALGLLYLLTRPKRTAAQPQPLGTTSFALPRPTASMPLNTTDYTSSMTIVPLADSPAPPLDPGVYYNSGKLAI